MRTPRFVTLLVGLVLAAVVAEAAPALGQPEASAGADQFALADWTVFTSRTQGVWYVAGVDRGAGAPFGVFNEAVVAKGTCTRYFVRHGEMVVCMAAGRSHELGLNEFQMDPMLSSASLSFRDRRYRPNVTWTGTGGGPHPRAGGGD